MVNEPMIEAMGSRGADGVDWAELERQAGNEPTRFGLHQALERESWQSIVYGSKIATAILTLDGEIATANDAFAGLLRVPSGAELAGTSMSELIAGTDPFADADAVASDPLLGRVLTMQLRCQDGSTAEVLLSYRVRTDVNGVASHIFCQLRTFQHRSPAVPVRAGRTDTAGDTARAGHPSLGLAVKAAARAAAAAPGPPGVRVLLVDDDEANASLVAGLLAAARDETIVQCETVRRFLSRAHVDGYDVVVLGVGALDASAVETLLRVRSVALRIPIVVLSDTRDGDVDHLIIANGAADLIPRNELPMMARAAGEMLAKLLRAAVDRYAVHQIQREHSSGFRRLVELNPDGIVVVDDDANVLLHNKSAARLLARHEDDLVHERFIHPFAVDEPYELDMRDDQGRPRTLEVHSVPVDWMGTPAHLVSLHDVTAHAQKERSLESTLMHDPLTALPGREIFLDRAYTTIRQGSERADEACAIALIDLDQFRRVNDTYGLISGDRVLQGVANRLTSSVRPGDYVARVGGDEFAVLFPSGPLDDQVIVAERIAEVLARPFEVDGDEIYCSPTVGLARHHGDGDESTLLGEAELAVVQNRRDGSGVSVADEASSSRRAVAMQMSARLADAVEEGQLFLMYQPIFDMVHGHLAGLEALVRWEHPDDGIITPGEFISIADESGTICSLGEWVFAEVADQIVEWQQRGADYLIPKVSVNVSPRQLAHPDFRRHALMEFARRDVSPSNVRLEVTEKGLAEQPKRSSTLLRRLVQDGFAIDLDDFGNGPTALSTLQEFPISSIKIDRSFVSRMIEVEDCRKVVQAGIAVAKAFGIGAVAVGVETKEQKELLARLGCDRAQGYLMARPLSAVEASRFFERRELAISAVSTAGHGADRAGTDCRRRAL